MDSNRQFQKCKIVSVNSSGELILERRNLENFLQTVRSTPYAEKISDAPIGLISVLGDAQSGKSLVTNVLIQYYQCEGLGWLDTLVDDINNNNSNDLSRRILGKVTTEQSEEGVYLWPEPLPQTDPNGSDDVDSDIGEIVRSVILVLYVVHRPNTRHKNNVKLLEHFVAVACSRVLEIVQDQTRRLHFPDILDDIINSEEDEAIPEYLCDHVLYILRSKGDLSDTQVQTLLESKFPTLGTSRQTRQSKFTCFQNHPSGRLHDTNTGLIDEAVVASMDGILSQVVNKITDALDFPEKTKIEVATGDAEADAEGDDDDYMDEVTLGTLFQHFLKCVHIANKFRQDPTDDPDVDDFVFINVTSADSDEEPARSESEGEDFKDVDRDDDQASMQSIEIQNEQESEKLDSEDIFFRDLESQNGQQRLDNYHFAVIPSKKTVIPVASTHSSRSSSRSSSESDSSSDLSEATSSSAENRQPPPPPPRRTSSTKPNIEVMQQRSVTSERTTTTTTTATQEDQEARQVSSEITRETSTKAVIRRPLERSPNTSTFDLVTLPPITSNVPPKRTELIEMQEVSPKSIDNLSLISPSLETSYLRKKDDNFTPSPNFSVIPFGDLRLSQLNPEQFPPSRGQGSDSSPLLPVVMYISPTKIMMASTVDNKLAMIGNEFGEQFTQTLVGISGDSKVLYGKDLRNKLDQSSGAGMLGQWNLLDHISQSTRFDNTDVITKKNGSGAICYIPVTTESILGFLQERLKQTAETKIRRKCDSVVMPVPAWLASGSAKEQLISAGKVAGFQNVRVLNHLSAAAYGWMETDDTSAKPVKRKEVVIISESCGHIDVAVYACIADVGVTLLAYQSSRSLKQQSSAEILKKSGGSSWLGYLTCACCRTPQMTPQSADQLASEILQILKTKLAFNGHTSDHSSKISFNLLVLTDSIDSPRIMEALGDHYVITEVKPNGYGSSMDSSTFVLQGATRLGLKTAEELNTCLVEEHVLLQHPVNFDNPPVIKVTTGDFTRTSRRLSSEVTYAAAPSRELLTRSAPKNEYPREYRPSEFPRAAPIQTQPRPRPRSKPETSVRHLLFIICGQIRQALDQGQVVVDSEDFRRMANAMLENALALSSDDNVSEQDIRDQLKTLEEFKTNFVVSSS